jgi:hypothetical protein
MNKPTNKTVSIMSLKVDTSVNIRLVNNYDLESMKEQIRMAGCIIKPLIIRGEDKVVLSGNRRTLAGQELYNDPSTSAELKERLSKVQVIEYTGLTEEETLQLVLDHGGEKPISKTEVVLSVWRLDKQMYSERQICTWMVNALADYTSNKRKLIELPSEPGAREKAIHRWLHGTVGNYILAASKLGNYVREQFLLTHKSDDKLLEPGEKVEMKCDRTRISDLTTARGKDQLNGTWSTAGGNATGLEFDKLIEKYKEEDRSGKKDKVERLSQKELSDKADQFSSPGIKAAFAVAAGNQDAGRQLHDIDAANYALMLKCEVLEKHGAAITDPFVKELVRVLTNPSLPAAAVEDALKPWLS